MVTQFDTSQVRPDTHPREAAWTLLTAGYRPETYLAVISVRRESNKPPSFVNMTISASVNITISAWRNRYAGKQFPGAARPTSQFKALLRGGWRPRVTESCANRANRSLDAASEPPPKKAWRVHPKPVHGRGTGEPGSRRSTTTRSAVCRSPAPTVTNGHPFGMFRGHTSFRSANSPMGSPTPCGATSP
jgi:hypothetical protein